MDAIVVGHRLTLRPITVDDIEPSYVRWMRDPEVIAYLESRFTQHHVDDVRAYVQAATADPDTYFFAIVVSDGDRHIGNIKLGPLDHPHRRGDIGIIIGERDCWGQGYASEAIAALATFAFDELDLHKVTAGAYSTNAASIRAFLKVGFVVEATRPEHYFSDGDWVDGVLLGRIRPRVRLTPEPR